MTSNADLIARWRDLGVHNFGAAQVDELVAALEAAEAERDRLREALEMLWTHYLLVISEEQKAQVRAALTAGSADE